MLAVAVSLVVHLVVMGGPAWRLPADDANVLPPLDARLMPLPSAPSRPQAEARPPVRPQPRPHPTARPRPQPVAEAEASSPEPATQAAAEMADGPAVQTPPADALPSQPMPQPVPEAVPAPAAPVTAGLPVERWLSRGKIQYNVIRGERNFIIGRTVHAWTHDESHYSMETVIETTGLVGLIKSFRMVQRSEGTLGPAGLAPEKFAVERNGELREKADFDWGAGVVRLVAGERRREAPLQPGDQDVLSLIHTLALRGDVPGALDMLLVTGKSAVRAHIENLGVEAIEIPATPQGPIQAVHLGSTGHGGELRIDIWLARDYANLPVRIKITDKNGDILDQVATGVDLPPQVPASAQPRP
jgi:hypothetical protein